MFLIQFTYIEETKKNKTAPWHQEDNKSKAVGSIFSSEMIAKLERTHSTAQLNKDLIQKPNKLWEQQRINNNRPTALELIAAETTWGLN